MIFTAFNHKELEVNILFNLKIIVAIFGRDKRGFNYEII